MQSRWRLFRQDGARAASLHPSAYLTLYLASLAIGCWAKATYGATVVWTANGVLLAGLLQLRRRDAVRFLITCAAMNLVGNALRHDNPVMLVFNVVLNFGEVVLAALIARRVCGAALDLRRPGRLLRFAVLAVVPATLIATALGVAAMQAGGARLFILFETWFSVEAIGLLAVTPPLLLWASGRRVLDIAPSQRAGRAGLEPYLLLGMLAAVTVAVFAQTVAPAPFLVFPPLLLIAYRLSPRWSAAAVLMVVLITAFCTLNGLGPLVMGGLAPRSGFPAGIVPVLGALPLYNMFIATVLLACLPVSTLLTERRRLEARLRARTEAAVLARRLAEEATGAKSRFLSMMSHEMRTPLNGVAGFAELLAARSDIPADALTQLGGIRRSSDSLLGLVEDILDFSRGDLDVTPAAFCLAAVVAEAAEAVREAAGAKGLALALDGELAPNARHIGDARRIRQVLRHLLSNAVKFTPTGAVAIHVVFEPHGVSVAIADSGPGLPPHLLDQMFDPFSQADAGISRTHQGAGLGLALSRRLAQLMGGEVCGANRAEGGAVFTLRLPLERVEDAAPASAADLETGSRPRVLVVDDHQTNRDVACLMLETLGCDHAVACDGLEAVEAAAAAPYDLILMDVRMPNMDGLAATRAIRALPAAASVPIVAMTADAMPEDVARCLAAGMDAHLAKPVGVEGLCNVLNRLLDAGGATGVDELAAA